MKFLAIAGLVLVSISCIITLYLGSELNFFLLHPVELVQLCFKSYLMELLYEYCSCHESTSFHLSPYIKYAILVLFGC